MKIFLTYLLLFFGALNLFAAPPVATPVPGIQFLEQHCFDCHDDDLSKGDLDLTTLSFTPGKSGNFKRWERVFDRVRAGEMPPKKKARPKEADKQAFLKALKQPLLAADRKDCATRGRVQLRRLTRREYEHTLHDLLGIDLPLSELLPEDPATHGFETVASGQQLSHHHLGRYLEAADLALADAFKRAEGKSKPYQHFFTAEKLGPTGPRDGNYRGPEFRDGLSIHWPMRPQFYGRMPATRVPEDGWYRITIKGLHAINPKNGVVWGSLESGYGYSNNPMMFLISTIEASAEKKDVVFDAWIREDHLLRLLPNDATLKTAPSGVSGGAVSYKGRDLIKEGFAAIAHSGITLERIYPNATREKVRWRLFGGINKEEFAQLSAGKNQRALLARILGSFARRAFRRPVSDEQLTPYLDLAMDTLQEPDTRPSEALRVAYRAMLCSPRFLTFIEAPGKLDDYAIATRLSYMLWNSMPDEMLRKVAEQGKLQQKWALDKQVERMLSDPKAERFITSFTDQWLSLREVNTTSPDLRMFNTWDAIVQDSMLAESRAFVTELLKDNLSVQHLIDSDFAMLNERLVRHYGFKDIPLTPGKGLQKVTLPKDGRGGLVTQGAILKVTANGTTTSPVVRGVWVNERLLGVHIPPPPPGVPAIEPDIRGAVSIRDQLDKHRNTEACMSCHLIIDPAGFALEQFDPVGRWRSKYGTRKNAATVDPSGTTPDGKTFQSAEQWKAIYHSRPRMLSKGFAEQLMTYATGAPLRFSDRDVIARIVDNAEKSGYGVRTLLKEVVSSEIFLQK